MPTAKPRITVTLEQHTYEVLSRLSAASGDSMSSFVSEYVNLALPSLERLVVVLERANSAPEEARAGLAAAIERAERTVLPAIAQAQDMGDLFLGDLASAMEPPARSVTAAVPPARAGKVAARAEDPRLVTRGSGGPKRAGKGVKRG